MTLLLRAGGPWWPSFQKAMVSKSVAHETCWKLFCNLTFRATFGTTLFTVNQLTLVTIAMSMVMGMATDRLMPQLKIKPTTYKLKIQLKQKLKLQLNLQRIGVSLVISFLENDKLERLKI